VSTSPQATSSPKRYDSSRPPVTRAYRRSPTAPSQHTGCRRRSA